MSIRQLSHPKFVLNVSAVVAGAIILVPTIGLMLNSAVSGRIPALYFPFFFLMVAYTDTVRYLALNITVIALIAAALVWARPNRWVTGWLIASMLAIVFFPLAFGRYEPALAARPGLSMVVPTEPESLLMGLEKRAQVSAEMRPCTYHLLGWAHDGRFYYQSMCGDEDAVWAVDAAAGERTARVISAPHGLSGETVRAAEALDLVRATGVSLESAEPDTRPLMLVDGEAMRSGDGRWLAVVSRHVYGPQDVLLIRTTDG